MSTKRSGVDKSAIDWFNNAIIVGKYGEVDRKAVEESADLIIDYAKEKMTGAFTSKSKGRYHGSRGPDKELVNNVAKTWSKNEKALYIGWQHGYWGKFWEFGFKHKDGNFYKHPMYRPALEEHKQEVLDTFGFVYEKELKL